jgi:hypothetical protein
MLSHYSTFFAIQILPKKIHIQCVQHKLKNIANIYSNEILFPLIPMPNIKVEQIFDTQMKHSHPIIKHNVPKKTKNKKHFDNALYHKQYY